MITIARHNLKIYNLNTDKVPASAAYVGRPTPFGNPYALNTDDRKGNVMESGLHKVKTRAEAVKKFREYCESNKGIGELAKRHLNGKDLACWCVPEECHAMVLMDLANAPEKVAEKAKGRK